jgi:TolB-like protein/Tfp pilus assembly protein PilF
MGRRFAFGQLVFDGDNGALFANGVRTPLGSKATALLGTLLEAEGRTVSKSDLLDAAWANNVVEESNLTVQVSALRKLLFELSGDGWIETVPRVGYRLVAHFAPLPAADALQDVPRSSIAVLPFANLGRDPEQQAFVDGLTEDLITDLSRNSGLLVIARHTVFSLRQQVSDYRAVSAELGVRYILEGSARRADGRVRVNVELIDGIDGSQQWADRIDCQLHDVFSLQDTLSSKIIEALLVHLTTSPLRKRPNNIPAYDMCLRARKLTFTATGSPEAVRENVTLLKQCISLDPSYAEAYRLLAFNLWSWSLWADTIEHRVSQQNASVEMARAALVRDPNDSDSHWVYGLILAYCGKWPDAEREFAAALDLNPNNADAWAVKADLAVLSGAAARALEFLKQAFRLNPHPPAWYFWELGFAQYAAGHYEAAISTLTQESTYRSVSRRILAASLAQQGRLEEAHREGELYLSSNPTFTICGWSSTHPFRHKNTLARFIEGYRKAGLPE